MTHPSDYLQELQAAEAAQDKMQLRTLKAKHRFSLERLPRLQSELDALLATEEAVDYAALVAAFDATVQQASEFLMAVDLAPVDYPEQTDLPALGHSLAALMTSTTVAALVAKFQQRCTAGVADAKARQAEEGKRQAAEAAAAEKVKAEEAKRQAAEAAAAEKVKAQTAAEQLRRETLINMGYVVKDDGTVTDTKTKLMWKQCAEGQTGPDCKGSPLAYNWDIAMKIPETLNQRGGFAGHNDWRLPTKDELSSLVMHGRQNPAICVEAFPNAPSTFFWSSSPGGVSGALFRLFRRR